MYSYAFSGIARSWLTVLSFTIYCSVAFSRDEVSNRGNGLPMFSDPLGNFTVPVGRNATLPCSIQNLGDYRVAWIHLERNMVLTVDDTVAARIPRFNLSYDHDRTRWHLHILSVEEEDEGRYMCRLNTDPRMEQVGYLKVVVPPSIIDGTSSPSSVSLKEGGSVELKCDSYGRPEPEIYWKREDDRSIRIDDKFHAQEVRGSILTLANVTRWEMAAYMCIAKNGIQPSVSKRILLDVLYPPSTHVVVAETAAILGHSAFLECRHEGNPTGRHYWVFNRTAVYDGPRHSISSTTRHHNTTSTLRIMDVEPHDFGKYECVARNRLGESRGIVELKELKLPPTTTTARTITTARTTTPPAPKPTITSSPDTSKKQSRQKGNKKSKKKDSWPSSSSAGHGITEDKLSTPGIPNSGKAGDGIIFIGGSHRGQNAFKNEDYKTTWRLDDDSSQQQQHHQQSSSCRSVLPLESQILCLMIALQFVAANLD